MIRIAAIEAGVDPGGGLPEDAEAAVPDLAWILLTQSRSGKATGAPVGRTDQAHLLVEEDRPVARGAGIERQDVPGCHGGIIRLVRARARGPDERRTKAPAEAGAGRAGKTSYLTHPWCRRVGPLVLVAEAAVDERQPGSTRTCRRPRCRCCPTRH
mgnify:CR=1 FL=1